MPLPLAWKTLGVEPTATAGEVKKAFRQKVRENHPDIVGDDGTQLQRVRDAYDLVESLANPTKWDFQGIEEGLPAWAAGLLNGVQWSSDCPSYAAFLEKMDQKALAVGELDEKTGERPWAATWGKYSQQDANTEALRVCRQTGTKCRLVYVGSGTARQRTAAMPNAGADEQQWWRDQFGGAGDLIGFGWMPIIDPEKEQMVGHKTISGGERFGADTRVRVPVFRHKTGRGILSGLPYYYSPIRPKERVFMKKANFQHAKRNPGGVNPRDERLNTAQILQQMNSGW